MNILISCCGTRNGVIRFFRSELEGIGKVAAIDCNPLAPALYEADLRAVVPRIDTPGYLDALFSLCRAWEIDGIVSLLDPELVFLSKHRDAFRGIGVQPVVSSPACVETSFDKYAMNAWLKEHGYPVLKTYRSYEEFEEKREGDSVGFPVFVKPRRGSGSNGAAVVHTMEELRFRLKNEDGMLIQEYARGVEYGADAYADLLSGEPAALFIRQPIRKRSGETVQCVSVRNDALCSLLSRFIREFGLVGPLDFDIIYYKEQYHIIDVNPRFGGEYPVAHQHGIDFPGMIVRNLAGDRNAPSGFRYEAGVYSMKHYEMTMQKELAAPWREEDCNDPPAD